MSSECEDKCMALFTRTGPVANIRDRHLHAPSYKLAQRFCWGPRQARQRRLWLMRPPTQALDAARAIVATCIRPLPWVPAVVHCDGAGPLLMDTCSQCHTTAWQQGQLSGPGSGHAHHFRLDRLYWRQGPRLSQPALGGLAVRSCPSPSASGISA